MKNDLVLGSTDPIRFQMIKPDLGIGLITQIKMWHFPDVVSCLVIAPDLTFLVRAISGKQIIREVT